MQTTNKRAMIILLITMFILMAGFGIILPILPFYAESMGATATHLGLLFASFSVVQFFFAPMWGQASDRYGRKPMIVIGLVGFGLSFVLFGLATSLWMLFASRILGGILSAAALPAIMAYIADTTDVESRGSGMGLMGAAAGIGITVGPVIGGFLGEVNPGLPFFFAAGLAFAVSIFALAFLPETISKASQLEARQTPKKRGGGLVEVWKALFGPVGFILVLAFLASFASANIEGTFALFSEVHLHFGQAEMGTLFGIMGIVMALTQALLVGRFIKRWGEQRMIQVGLVSSALGYLLMLVTFNMASMALVLSIMAVGNAAMRPAVNSLVSKRTPPKEQGSMMGIVNSYNSLGRIFGPIVGGVIFDSMGYQWPYISGALLFFLIYLLSIYLFRRNRHQEANIAAIPSLSSQESGVAGSQV